MAGAHYAKVAIGDYGLGNLFSVKHACEHVGLQVSVNSSWHEILSADGVILPGVGAFGDSMESLKRLDLISPLREIGLSQKPLIGICLGIRLLMTESCEFGAGHPSEPIALADYIGLDVCLQILENLHDATRNAKYLPSSQLISLVHEGNLGRKTGQGVYTYKRLDHRS